jgi:hypothetical protein
MFIGRSARYYVPENIANQIAFLDDHRDPNDDKIVRFPEMDDDIAHTLIHYLYKGTYETLRPASPCNMPTAVVEYTRSVLSYHAGQYCGLDGLAVQARQQMQALSHGVSVQDIISIGRQYFLRISEDEWFSEYLTTKIIKSFEMDESIFEQEEFLAGFGEAPDFDRFLARVMGKAYAQQISSIRGARGTMGDDLGPPLTIKNEFDANDGRVEDTQIDQTPDQRRELDRISGETPKLNCPPGDDVLPYSEHEAAAHGVCPDWEQHSMRENGWISCPRCKKYIMQVARKLVVLERIPSLLS